MEEAAWHHDGHAEHRAPRCLHDGLALGSHRCPIVARDDHNRGTCRASLGSVVDLGSSLPSKGSSVAGSSSARELDASTLLPAPLVLVHILRNGGPDIRRLLGQFQ